MKKLNVNLELLIIDNGIPHGFLNMNLLSKETWEGFVEVTNCLGKIIEKFDDELKENEVTNE